MEEKELKDVVRKHLKAERERTDIYYRECNICPVGKTRSHCNNECYIAFSWFNRLRLFINLYSCPCFVFKSKYVIEKTRLWLES